MFNQSSWEIFWVAPRTGQFIGLLDLISDFEKQYSTEKDLDILDDYQVAEATNALNILCSNRSILERESAFEDLTYFILVNEEDSNSDLISNILIAIRQRADDPYEARPIRVISKLYLESTICKDKLDDVESRLSRFNNLMLELYFSEESFANVTMLPWDPKAYPELLGDSVDAPIEKHAGINYLLHLENPSDVVHFRIGCIHCTNRNYIEGVRSFSKAIEKNPTFSLYYKSRGFAQFNSGSFRRAKEDLEKWMKFVDMEIAN